MMITGENSFFPKKKRGRGRPKGSGNSPKKNIVLAITGRTKNNRLIVLSVAKEVHDALKMYAIVKGIPGGAKGAVVHMVAINPELKTLNEYLKQHAVREKREQFINSMEEEQ